MCSFRPIKSFFSKHQEFLKFIMTFFRFRREFKSLLEETGYVTPGKDLSEVRVLFMGRECYEALQEDECADIYAQHQRDIINRAKNNFQVREPYRLSNSKILQVEFHFPDFTWSFIF